MVTWDLEIGIVDLARKEASVRATRTDDSVDPPETRLFTIDSIIVDTNLKPLAEIKDDIVNNIWGHYQADIMAEQQIVALLSGWETALENDLNTLETP